MIAMLLAMDRAPLLSSLSFYTVYLERNPFCLSWALFSFQKFCKIFEILRHIESLDVCVKY